jgi:hypothetical protein
MKQKAISERNKHKSGCGRLFIAVWGLGFFSFGVFFIWMTAISPYLSSQTAAPWPSADCKILSSKVESHTDGDGDTSYSPKIEFEFSVDGKTIVGDRHSFSKMSGSSSSANKIVDRYPKGSQSVCFYNPQDQSQSVLSREFEQSLIWMSLFPLIFVVIGAVAILASVMGWGFGKKRDSNTAVSAEISPLETDGTKIANQLRQSGTLTHAADLEDEQWSAPKKLKTEQSRLTAFLVTCAFAAFWNGIVGVFVGVLIFDSHGFWSSLGFLLFLTPFILIGLVLIFACVYMFLKLFTPQVEVALSTGAVPLGGEVDIAWEVIGRTSRLRNLKLEIQGEQTATYRHGTDTRTDTEIFEIIPVGEVTSQDHIRFGSVTVRIPEFTMHTHEGTNNKITWSVIVKGEIRWWPDVFESFPFRIKPISAYQS